MEFNAFQISDHMPLNVSPISVIDQTNNISFSMEDSSHHSQFSQSGYNKIQEKQIYESVKI